MRPVDSPPLTSLTNPSQSEKNRKRLGPLGLRIADEAK